MTTPESQKPLQVSPALRKSILSGLIARCGLFVVLPLVIVILALASEDKERTDEIVLFGALGIAGMVHFFRCLARAGVGAQYLVTEHGLTRRRRNARRQTFQWSDLHSIRRSDHDGEVLVFKPPNRRKQRVLVDPILDEPSSPLGKAIREAISGTQAEEVMQRARRRYLSYFRWIADRSLAQPLWRSLLFWQGGLALSFGALLIAQLTVATPIQNSIIIGGWFVFATLIAIFIPISRKSLERRVNEFDKQNPDIKPLLDSGEIRWHWWQTKP